MRRPGISAIELMAMIATQGPRQILTVNDIQGWEKQPKKPQYGFSEEEKEQLAKLEGKAKKKFLKELKAKYE